MHAHSQNPCRKIEPKQTNNHINRFYCSDRLPFTNFTYMQSVVLFACTTFCAVSPYPPRWCSGLASIAAAYLMHNMNLWISSAFNISTEFQYIHLIDMGQGGWGWHERSATRRGVGGEEKIINTKDANRVIHIMAINIDLLLWCQMHELWCTNMWVFNPGITEYKIPVYLCMNNHFISWNNRSDRVCLREREREREKAFAK